MSSAMMKAIRLHEFGGPDVLRYEDAPKPTPKAGEVLIRVHAVGINPPDWYLRDGMKALPAEWRPPFRCLPFLHRRVRVVEAVGPSEEPLLSATKSTAWFASELGRAPLMPNT
jgi:NADPH:quinone reductase-like Zn-dependent oxidoreductase